MESWPVPVFGAEEEREADRLIRQALAEDLPAGDATSESLIPASARARSRFVAREAGIACGIPVALRLFAILDARVACRTLAADGQELEPGQALLEVEGPARALLAGERSALNFLQRLSGIATRTRELARMLAGTGVVLLDTRKTLPGWRMLEKYAVRAGGGANHRLSLSDQALVKDNHIQVLRALGRGGPREWVEEIRRRHPGLTVEIEVATLEEFREAADSGADIILLDNMAPADMARAARELRGRTGKRPLLEGSGGINAGSLRQAAASGLDRISVGAITHSARAMDIAMDLLEVTRDADST